MCVCVMVVAEAHRHKANGDRAILLLDQVSAFTSLSHMYLWPALLAQGVPADGVCILQGLYAGAISRVRSGMPRRWAAGSAKDAQPQALFGRSPSSQSSGGCSRFCLSAARPCCQFSLATSRSRRTTSRLSALLPRLLAGIGLKLKAAKRLVLLHSPRAQVAWRTLVAQPAFPLRAAGVRLHLLLH